MKFVLDNDCITGLTPEALLAREQVEIVMSMLGLRRGRELIPSENGKKLLGVKQLYITRL